MSDPHVHAEPRSPAEANNRFAVEMYGHLRDRPGNLLFSPFSLRTALVVAHAGARGGTATEMARTLRISPSNENQRWLSDIVRRLEAGGEHEVVVSTSLWMQDGVVQATFLDVIAREYHGAAFHADFRDHAEAARLKINRSIEEVDLIRFGGRVDYVDLVSSSFVEESLQGLGGVRIGVRRPFVAADERPVAI